MKHFALAALIALGAIALATPAAAHDAYDDSQSHPLRLVAYAAHPAGWLAEWIVMRPIHFLVSQPSMEQVFGHVPHENPFGEYGPYEDLTISDD